MSTFRYADFIEKFPDCSFRRLLRSRVELTHFLAIVGPGLATLLRGDGPSLADRSTIDRGHRERIADLAFPIAFRDPDRGSVRTLCPVQHQTKIDRYASLTFASHMTRAWEECRADGSLRSSGGPRARRVPGTARLWPVRTAHSARCSTRSRSSGQGPSEGSLENGRETLLAQLREKFGRVPRAFGQAIRETSDRRRLDRRLRRLVHAAALDETRIARDSGRGWD